MLLEELSKKKGLSFLLFFCFLQIKKKKVVIDCKHRYTMKQGMLDDDTYHQIKKQLQSQQIYIVTIYLFSLFFCFFFCFLFFQLLPNNNTHLKKKTNKNKNNLTIEIWKQWRNMLKKKFFTLFLYEIIVI